MGEIELEGSAQRKRGAAEEALAVAPLPDHKKQRKEWAARMRQILSPPGMLNEEGTIKQVRSRARLAREAALVRARRLTPPLVVVSQDFFKPKKVVIHVSRKWGDVEKEKLLEVSERKNPVLDRSKPVLSSQRPAAGSTSLRFARPPTPPTPLR